MTDFAVARHTMVENQLRPYDVTDQVLLAGFEQVAREAFIDTSLTGQAYLDRELTARDGKTRMLTPMVLARMIQALELNKGEKVLDVGGAGYGAALLTSMGLDAVALESNPEPARTALAATGFGNITVVGGNLADGAKDHGPFDAILVHGASEIEPTVLLSQLKEDGVLAIVMGRGRSGRASIFKKIGNSFSRARAFDAAAPVLAQFERKLEFTF